MPTPTIERLTDSLVRLTWTSTSGSPGDVYMTDGTSLYTVDTADASTTLVGAFGGGITQMRSLGYSFVNEKFYGQTSLAGGKDFYEIDPDTGAATQLATFGSESPIADYIEDNDLFYGIIWEKYVRIDNLTTTPTLTEISAHPIVDPSNPGACLVKNSTAGYVGRHKTLQEVTDFATMTTTGVDISLTGDITNGIRSATNKDDLIYGVDITGSSGSGRLVTINPSTGACAVVGVDGNPGTWFGVTSTEAAATDTPSWVLCDGVLLKGPIVTSDPTRSIEVTAPKGNTYVWEVIDSDDLPPSIYVIPNHTPFITWRTVADAQSYSIVVDGDYVKSVNAVSDTTTQTTQLPRRLSEGWHKVEVVTSGSNGSTATSESRWVQIFAPGGPVPSITVVDGSGPGLFDITIP